MLYTVQARHIATAASRVSIGTLCFTEKDHGICKSSNDGLIRKRLEIYVC